MANNRLIIKTPRGEIVTIRDKNGKCTASLGWNPSFGAQRTDNFSKAQSFLDSEVLRLCGAYVPFDTGALEKSGQLGTVIGSGEVVWNCPYAAAQYWGTSESRAYDGQRGGKWFERMKVDNKDEIIEGAKKLGGGK